MLTLKISQHLAPNVVEILTTLTMCHASETPVIAATHRLLDEYPGSDHKYRVTFYDGRFPLPGPDHNDSKPVATLRFDPEKLRWEVSSPTRINIPGRGRRGKSRDYLLSRSIKTTIKNVLSVIHPMHPSEIIEAASGSPRGFTGDWVSAARQPFEKLTKYLSGDVLMSEVQYLYQMGVTFSTPQFTKLVREGLPLFAEFKAREASAAKSTNVQVCVMPGEQVLLTWVDRKTNKPLQQAYADYNDLPDAIASKLAMVRFTDINSFVPEVGRKMSETQFWLILTDEEIAQVCASVFGTTAVQVA